MRNYTKHFYEFGPFRLDPEKHRLVRNGELIHLPPKAMEALTVFVQHPNEVLEREALMQAVWADAFVEDGNLTVAISHLRKALEQNSETAEYIETIPRVGYCFIADVRKVIEEPAPLIIEKHTLSRTVIEEEQPVAEASELTQAVCEPAQRTLPLPQTRMSLALAFPIIALMAALGTGLIWALRARNPVAHSASIKSIAVLPFRVMDSGNDDRFQGLGMADVLITRLSNLKNLTVRPTSAVVSFENQEDSIGFGKKLDVDAVMEGTIYRTDKKVRVTARLLRVADGSAIWTGQFEKLLRDELRIQDEIAMQVVDALAFNLSQGEKNALTKRLTENADAHQLYQKGRYEWNKRSLAGMIEAERLFRNAIEKDPNFALAYIGLADTIATNNARSSETFDVVEKALELDPNLAEAHATLGFLKMFHNWEWREAENAYKKSIALNSNYATAHHWYAELLKIEGRHEEAKAEMLRALEINPLSHNFLADLGQVYYFNREYKKGEEYCRKALGISPDFVFAHRYLADIYLRTGEYDRAVEEFLVADKLNTSFANQSAEMQKKIEKNEDKRRRIYGEGGIRKFLENLNAESQDGYVKATIYAFLGEREKALACLEKAHEGKGFLSAFVKVDPVFNSLRGEPRYQAVLKNMGLD